MVELEPFVELTRNDPIAILIFQLVNLCQNPSSHCPYATLIIFIYNSNNSNNNNNTNNQYISVLIQCYNVVWLQDGLPDRELMC